MNSPADQQRFPAYQDSLRGVIWLIILCSAAFQLGRIIQVESATGEVPFFSANDRSRWCTIAALAVKGTYEIDDVIELRDPETKRRAWYTIDLVRHRGADGQLHYYSSKPPLLPTIYAGVYVVLRSLTGATLMGDPFLVARLMLMVVNLIPLVAFWLCLMRWLSGERVGAWATLVIAVFVSWGTYLSTFANSLNNHLPAALSAGISLWCLDRVLLKRDCRARWFAVCGLATSFCTANELPALSWLCAAGALLAVGSLRLTVVAYLPALLPVAIAFFATNYAAHGVLAPAYAHRDVGTHLADIQLSVPPSSQPSVVAEVATQLSAKGIECSVESEIREARRPNTWELWDGVGQNRYALRIDASEQSQPASGEAAELTVAVYEWGDWYDYPGSYWTDDRKQGVDRGEPNRMVYIFHSLIGHHGVFSLTPFWFVSVAGFLTVAGTCSFLNLFRERRLLVATAIAATSLVVLGFYFARGLEDRNYGGVSSGFRWTFWLIPLWLWLSVDAMRRVDQPWLRRLIELSVVVSVFSATYPWKNPWTPPWIMQWMEYVGWW